MIPKEKNTRNTRNTQNARMRWRNVVLAAMIALLVAIATAGGAIVQEAVAQVKPGINDWPAEVPGVYRK